MQVLVFSETQSQGSNATTTYKNEDLQMYKTKKKENNQTWLF